MLKHPSHRAPNHLRIGDGLPNEKRRRTAPKNCPQSASQLRACKSAQRVSRAIAWQTSRSRMQLSLQAPNMRRRVSAHAFLPGISEAAKLNRPEQVSMTLTAFKGPTLASGRPLRRKPEAPGIWGPRVCGLNIYTPKKDKDVGRRI